MACCNERLRWVVATVLEIGEAKVGRVQTAAKMEKDAADCLYIRERRLSEVYSYAVVKS